MAQDDKTRANALIDKYDGWFSSLDVNGLCDELSITVMSYTYTVFEVFNVMSERGYSQTALEQVATNLINRINQTNLIELAKSMHGTILLNRVQYLMNCEANPNQTVCQHIAVGVQRANEKLREQDKKKPNDTGQPRKLTDVEIAYYKAKVPKGGKFDEAIVWDLPSNGTGFVVYNPDDMQKDLKGRAKYNDNYGYDQIGTKATIDSVIRLATEWSMIHPQRLLQIGDINRPGGIDTPDHLGHVTGVEVDVRPLRNDSLTGKTANLDYNSPAYDQGLTIELIRLIIRLFPSARMHFNDPKIYNDSEFRGIVTPDSAAVRRTNPVHHNHVHIEFS